MKKFFQNRIVKKILLFIYFILLLTISFTYLPQPLVKLIIGFTALISACSVAIRFWEV